MLQRVSDQKAFGLGLILFYSCRTGVLVLNVKLCMIGIFWFYHFVYLLTGTDNANSAFMNTKSFLVSHIYVCLNLPDVALKLYAFLFEINKLT